MKLLVIHNFYTQVTGEDLMVRLLTKTLKDSGQFEIIEYHKDSGLFQSWPWQKKILALLSGNMPFFIPRDFRAMLERQRPQLALVHNTIPLINPWILKYLKKHAIPVVASIHNFRMLCPQGTCVRNEQFCFDCFNKTALYSVFHNCLNNYPYAVLYALRFFVHKHLRRYIDQFICSVEYRTQFLKELLPELKISFLINYFDVDRDLIASNAPKKDYILFAGRFVAEKGVRLVLECARQLKHRHFKMCGDGPLKDMCRDFITKNSLTNLEILPWAGKREILTLIRDAKLFFFPTLCIEFGLVMWEAMLLKTPVIVTVNAVSETVINHGENGFLFDPKDIETLPKLIDKLWDDQALLTRVALNAYEKVKNYNDPDVYVSGFKAICNNLLAAKQT